MSNTVDEYARVEIMGQEMNSSTLDHDQPAMVEVEVKYHIEDLAAVSVALARRGVTLSGPVHQDDQAYAPSSWSYGDSKIGVTQRPICWDRRYTYEV